MKFRVHLFALVRVEHELDAGTPEDAARLAFAADLNLYRRFAGPGQEYAEEVDDVCLVDPLTDQVDQDGRQIPDYEWSQWLRVMEFQQPDGTLDAFVEPVLLDTNTHFHVKKPATHLPSNVLMPPLVAC